MPGPFSVAVLLLATFSSVSSCRADSAQLVVGPVSVVKKGVLQASVQFTQGRTAVSGLQFDLRYDPSAVSIQVTPGKMQILASKRLLVADLNGRTKRVVLTGVNQTRVPDGDVVVLTLTLKNTSASAGSIPNLMNPVGTSGSADAVPIATSPTLASWGL